MTIGAVQRVVEDLDISFEKAQSIFIIDLKFTQRRSFDAHLSRYKIDLYNL